MKNKVNEEKETYMVFVPRRLLYIILLMIQSLVLIYFLISGGHGYVAMLKIRENNRLIEVACKKRQQDIYQLLVQLYDWKNSVFLQEKYARQKLHMGKKEEQVFFYE